VTYDVSPQHILEDLELSGEHQKEAIQKARDRRRRIHGPYWSGDWNASDRPSLNDFDPENHGYEMMRLMMPRLAGNVPVIELDSNRPEPEASEIAALEFAINRWVIDTNYRATRQLLAADYMIAWAVSICGLAPRAGLKVAGDPVLWPFMKRLPYRQFRFDPAASYLGPGVGDARWAAHRMVRDKAGVLRDAKAHPELGWDEKVIEGLATDVGFDDTDDAIRARVSRRELVYWCFWVPEHELDRFPDGRPGRPTREMGFNGSPREASRDPVRGRPAAPPPRQSACRPRRPRACGRGRAER
jgi:hypothetical protein